MGKLDLILRGAHFDIRIKIYFMMSVMVTKLIYAEVWEGNAKLAQQLGAEQKTAAKRILGSPTTTSEAVLRAEFGLTVPNHDRDRRKMKQQSM